MVYCSRVAQLSLSRPSRQSFVWRTGQGSTLVLLPCDYSKGQDLPPFATQVFEDFLLCPRSHAFTGGELQIRFSVSNDIFEEPSLIQGKPHVSRFESQRTVENVVACEVDQSSAQLIVGNAYYEPMRT